MKIIFFFFGTSEMRRKEVIEHIEQDIRDITEITLDTVDELTKRGDLLDTLVSKSQKLSESSEKMLWTVREKIGEGITHKIIRVAVYAVRGIFRGLFLLLYQAVKMGILVGKQTKTWILFFFPNEEDILYRLEQQGVEDKDE
jgi:hypothetical protein